MGAPLPSSNANPDFVSKHATLLGCVWSGLVCVCVCLCVFLPGCCQSAGPPLEETAPKKRKEFVKTRRPLIGRDLHPGTTRTIRKAGLASFFVPSGEGASQMMQPAACLPTWLRGANFAFSSSSGGAFAGLDTRSGPRNSGTTWHGFFVCVGRCVFCLASSPCQTSTNARRDGCRRSAVPNEGRRSMLSWTLRGAAASRCLSPGSVSSDGKDHAA